MLRNLLKHIVRCGTLTLIRPNGAPYVFGEGEPSIAVRLHDRRALLALALNPELKLGELYMDGRLTVENGDIADLLGLLMMNMGHNRTAGTVRAMRACRRLYRTISQYNPVLRAKAHAAHHYDLSGRLYELFLDRDKQYSCAYFSEAGENAFMNPPWSTSDLGGSVPGVCEVV